MFTAGSSLVELFFFFFFKDLMFYLLKLLHSCLWRTNKTDYRALNIQTGTYLYCFLKSYCKNHSVKLFQHSVWYMFSSTGVKTNQNMSYGLKEPVGVWHGVSIIPLQHLVFLRKRITKGTWQCSDRGSTVVPGSEPSGMDVQSCLVLISWLAGQRRKTNTEFMWPFLHGRY